MNVTVNTKYLEDLLEQLEAIREAIEGLIPPEVTVESTRTCDVPGTDQRMVEITLSDGNVERYLEAKE
jgi:hypothetical protein